MKRILLISVLILVSVFSVSAVSLRIGLGAVSSAGVSFESDRWDFDLDIRSVHPVFSLVGPQVLPKVINEEADAAHWRQLSSNLFNGLGASASFRFLQSEKNSLSVGLDLVAGLTKDGRDSLDFLPVYEKAIFAFLAVQLRYSFNINSHHALFVSMAYPFCGWLHVCAVPNNNDGYAIDTELWVPYSFKQIEISRHIDNLALYATVGLVAASLRFGYVYSF
ncbi:MAG: hypothetical protein J6X41_01220 [Spirochaetales bacterium]|nr:hypothetical protein [Spirochaetales bacterium]